MSFSEELISWYNKNKRELPWRNTRDPYKIWLSEIILQQTKVQQGLPYYNLFINEFPTVHHLANAPEDKVLKAWQGLGYYSRARNLQYTAKMICNEYNGIFPNNYKDILSLKGVGTYTAAAISSFAFNLNYAVLDGNVIRVLSRVFGLDTFFDTGKGKKEFQELADLKLPRDNAYAHNQAIMEFGALVCTPRKPACFNCVFKDSCFAKNQSLVESLPKKSLKTKVRDRYLFYLVIENTDSIYFIKKKQGIWSGLYEFPLIEFSSMKTNNQVIISKEFQSFFSKKEFVVNKISPLITHKLSHQKLHVKFVHINCNSKLSTSFKKVSFSQINDLPVSRLIDKYLLKNLVC